MFTGHLNDKKTFFNQLKSHRKESLYRKQYRPLFFIQLTNFIQIQKCQASFHKKPDSIFKPVRNKNQLIQETCLLVDVSFQLDLLFFSRHNQSVTLAMHIIDFDRWVIFKMLTQLGNIHIHTSGIEIIVVNPNGLQCQFSLKNIIGMSTKE